MPSDSQPRSRDYLALAGFLLLCLAVSAAGGAITATSVDGWYQTLTRPPFNPPDWVFAPVWTTLYVLMAVAAWRVWRSGPWAETRLALSAWGVQLALNLAWSFLFFGLRSLALAFLEVLVLLAAIGVTALLFRRHDGWAAVLLLPYIAWVAFAALLNGSLWLLNPGGGA
jgi:tryptophan-rich sensory protein